MENLKEIVAQNLSALRTRSGMTQSELAEKLNYSDKSVSKWERGDSLPDKLVIEKMADIFGVTVDYMCSPHSMEEDALIQIRHRMIIRVVMAGVWTLALLTFIILWLCGKMLWIIFVAAIPISLIALLVLHSVWEGGKRNFHIISVLCASIICTVYFIFLRYNWWQLFLLLIPAELIVILCFKIKNPMK